MNEIKVNDEGLWCVKEYIFLGQIITSLDHEKKNQKMNRVGMETFGWLHKVMENNISTIT